METAAHYKEGFSEKGDRRVMLLEVQDLTRHFGGLSAVNHMNFCVESGEIVGLIGPNGAGKTTVFNLISGVLQPDGGRILFRGEDISSLKPYKIAKKGISRTFQLTNLFEQLSVIQNILVGCHLRVQMGFLKKLMSGSSVGGRDNEILKTALGIVDFMGLSSMVNETAENLPVGHQRSLSIAMALAADPELLLLDEPFIGMTIEELNVMMNRINGLVEQGITILLVEHNMKAVMNLCHRIVVMDQGRKLTEGLPEEVKRDKDVITAYLGEV